jgi:hypothetical protein
LDYLATHKSISPIRREFAIGFVYCTKGGTRLAVASDKVNQLLANGWWFSPSTPISHCQKVIKTDNDITIALIMACYPYLFDNDI